MALRKWFLAVYTYVHFNTSLRPLGVEFGVSYKKSIGACSASCERWIRLNHTSKA